MQVLVESYVKGVSTCRVEGLQKNAGTPSPAPKT